VADNKLVMFSYRRQLFTGDTYVFALLFGRHLVAAA